MHKVVFVKGNLINREVRFPKMFHSLTENGYNVSYVGWNRDNKTPNIMHRDPGKYFTEIIFNCKSPWGAKILFYLPLWWSFVFIQLMKSDCDLVTAGEFISLPPAILAGKIKNKPVIYDMADVYEDQICTTETSQRCMSID